MNIHNRDHPGHDFYYDLNQKKVFCFVCDALVTIDELHEPQQILDNKIEEWQLQTQFTKMKMEDTQLTYERFIYGLKNKKYAKVVILTGAGISVSAGIPDFRSPGSGIYANLQKYKLERPEDLVTLKYFLEKPEVFYAFSKEFDLEKYQPTPTHHFLRLMDQKGLLNINLTQNIDNLEEKAGLDPDKLV